MQSVVGRTGVPADTIRSWERRHGFPNPARDAQNQRVYSDQDIMAIMHLKEQTSRGITVKEALRLLPGSPQSGHAQGPTIRQSPDTGSTAKLDAETPAPVIERLVNSLLAFDGAGARTLLHTEMATQSPESIAFESILPAAVHLANISDPGATFATEFLRRMLLSLFNASDPDSGREQVLMAGVSGCQDELLALAHALSLSRMGFVVSWLGLNCELSALQLVIARIQPSAVILVAEDAKTSAIAERWWSSLDEHSLPRGWNGRRFIASPRPLTSSNVSGTGDPLWLAPHADAARVLLHSERSQHRDGIRIVSNQ